MTTDTVLAGGAQEEGPATEVPSILPLEVDSIALPNVEGYWAAIRINSGITTLLGPNGAGKTQVLRGLKSKLMRTFSEQRIRGYVRFLSAGRVAPFDIFRSAVNSPHMTSEPGAVGHTTYRSNRMDFESIVGDVMALQERPDLRIKIEARLFKLFERNLTLEWTQSGLQVGFTSREGRYFSNTEASGVLHLIGLLAALYDDSISALLIDEPEISLHPQLQAFLLNEIQNVAGDPRRDAAKKLVILSTHSPSMLRIRTVKDLPDVVFFTKRSVPPVQIAPQDSILQRRKLAAFVSRISETHKTAFFAQTVLLVEGPSDEIIVSALERDLDRSLAGSGVSILPVIGKGEFAETLKMFRTIGKRVAVLTDLDALVDDSSLAASFQDSEIAAELAVARGHDTFPAMAAKVKAAISETIKKNEQCLVDLSKGHRYLTDIDNSGVPTEKAKARVAYVSLLNAPIKELRELPDGKNLDRARAMLLGLLEVMEAAGCFVLRRGTIEDYFISIPGAADSGKPEAAVTETLGFSQVSAAVLSERYGDVVRAIDFVAPSSPFDENLFIRSNLAGALGHVFQMASPTTTDVDLSAILEAANPQAAAIFAFKNASDGRSAKMAVRVEIKSPLFPRSTFPAVVTREQNLSDRVDELLPPAA